MRKEDARGSDRGCESPLKTGQHRNINNAQYTKGAKNPEKQHATASVVETVVAATPSLSARSFCVTFAFLR